MELKECVGCGKVDKLQILHRVITFWDYNARWWVECKRCNWRGPESKAEEGAVYLWNTRKVKNGNN